MANVEFLTWKLPLGCFALTRRRSSNVLEPVRGSKRKNLGMSVNIVVGSETLEAVLIGASVSTGKNGFNSGFAKSGKCAKQIGILRGFSRL